MSEDVIVIEEERKYRSDTEILYEILHVIMSAGDRGIKKTHLMYKTNLNSKMLARYLDMLLKADLIEEIRHGKHKIVRPAPLGKLAYVNLRILKKILFEAEEPRELNHIRQELRKLGKQRWNIHFGRIVLGKSGLEYKPTAVATRERDRFLIDVYLGLHGLESRALLLHFIMSLVDTDSKGIVVTDDKDLERAVPQRLRDIVWIVPVRPLDTLLERVLEVMERESTSTSEMKGVKP